MNKPKPLEKPRDIMSEKTLVERLERASTLSWLDERRQQGFGPQGIIESLREYVHEAATALTQAQARCAEERDAALAEAAKICLAQKNSLHPPLTPGYVYLDLANVMAEKCAAAIRSLKAPR